jgi:hypothetical protein
MTSRSWAASVDLAAKSKNVSAAKIAAGGTLDRLAAFSALQTFAQLVALSRFPRISSQSAALGL